MARSNTGSSSNWLNTTTLPVTGAPFTIACWFKVADAATFYNLVTISQAASSNQYFVLAIDGTVAGDPVRAIAQSISGPEGVASTTSGITADTWQHACAVYTSATSRAAFINGGSKGTDTLSRAPASVDYLSVGAGRFSGSMFSPINGSVAELGVWNIDLTDDEVAALGKGYSPLLVRPSALIDCWRLIGRDSPETNLKRVNSLTINGTMSIADHLPIIMPRRRLIIPKSVGGAPPPSNKAGPLVNSVILKGLTGGALAA
jgi:hypothetical protein